MSEQEKPKSASEIAIEDLRDALSSQQLVSTPYMFDKVQACCEAVIATLKKESIDQLENHWRDVDHPIVKAFAPVLDWYQSDEIPDRPFSVLLQEAIEDLTDDGELLEIAAVVSKLKDTLVQIRQLTYE